MALVKVEVSFEYDLDTQSQTLDEAIVGFKEELEEEFEDTKKLNVKVIKL